MRLPRKQKKALKNITKKYNAGLRSVEFFILHKNHCFRYFESIYTENLHFLAKYLLKDCVYIRNIKILKHVFHFIKNRNDRNIKNKQ